MNHLAEMDKLLANRKDPFNFEHFFDLGINVVQGTMDKLFFERKMESAKNKQTSTFLRGEGTKVFLSSGNQTTALIKALETYTKCIMFAPVDSEEIALGYANRSAVLLKLNRPVECLEDISRAKKSNYPDHLLPKLFYREGDCYEKLVNDCYMEAKYWLTNFPQENAESYQEKLKNYSPKTYVSFIEKEQLIVPVIKTPSEKFPCASAAIDVKHSDTFGRHIVATRDIEPGEVLIVERPYCKMLNIELKQSHCNNCMINVWNGIPCEHCVNVIFCSEECKADAWTRYHQFTCPLFVLHHEKDLSSQMASLRLFLEFVYEAGGVKELKERIKNLQIKSDKPAWPLNNEWYKKNSLESIITLSTHVNKIEGNVLGRINSDSLWAVFDLATLTDFFGSKYKSKSGASALSSMSKDPDVTFIGGLLIKLALINRYNAEKLMEYTGITSANRFQGNALMPLSSLMNFSCFQNTLKQFKKNHVVIYARFPIKKGEQIYTSGGFDFSLTKKSLRQHGYQSNYQFTCSCVACRENWPTSENMSFPCNSQDYKLKKGFDDERSAREVEAALQRSTTIGLSVLGNNYEDKDKILMEHCNTMKLFHERAVLPCLTINCLTSMISTIYDNMGNVTLERLVDLQCDA